MTRPGFIKASLCAWPVLLASCGGSQVAQPPAGAVEVRGVHARQTEVVRIQDRCPLSDRPAEVERTAVPLVAGVVAALIPTAVQFVVSGVRDYLARLEAERTATYTAIGSGMLPAQGNACLIVLRGHLGEPPTPLPPRQGALDTDAMRELGLAATPDFYMEARLIRRPRGNPPANARETIDLILQPQFVHFARTAARRGRDEAKTIGMVLVLRHEPAAAGANAATAATGAAAVFPLNFGAMQPGTEIRPSRFPPAPDPIGPAHPLYDLARSTPVAPGQARLNAYAFVTETAEPERLLVLLNETLRSQADGLQAALTATIQDAVKAALAPPQGARQ